MAEYSIQVNENGAVRRISAREDRTLLESMALGGSTVHAPCGGNGKCKQCRVQVSGPCRDMAGRVREYFCEEVLACRVYPAGELRVESAVDVGGRVRTDTVDIAPGGDGLGLAVDIGTTTVAAYLYDLKSGKCIASRGGMNAQRAFGSDVISRIQHGSSPEGLAALGDAVRGQICALAADMCGDVKKIKYVSVAGNTVMEHLLMGLSPESIGVAPFKPRSAFGMEIAAKRVLPGFANDCGMYICPAVSGYVGGDITAGLVGSGAYKSEKTLLYIDIGTNGEMALGDSRGFITCATAAGPAFEGGEIACGSPAQKGAIDSVADDLSFSVIDGGEAKSICGSGLIDAVAALLYNGELDEGGCLGEEKYFFNESVYLSRADIRALQLAKAAVRAGVETLLQISGKSYADVDELLIAGGFGAYLNPRSACAIGLLPPEMLGKLRHVGNSAGLGAALCLTEAGRRAVAALARSCGYVELSSSPLFNEKYIEAMAFDEWEAVL